MTGRIQFTVKHRKQFDDDLVLTNNRKGREGRIGYMYRLEGTLSAHTYNARTSFRNKPRNTPWPRRCHSQDGPREGRRSEGEREV